ncbi:unnamed protein product [Cunninghamella blakesleeana]
MFLIRFLPIQRTIIIVSFFYLSCIQSVYGQSDNNTIKPRIWPSCSVIEERIYCFGGLLDSVVYTNNASYETPVNDHLFLDFGFFDRAPSLLQWRMRSNNTINGEPLEPMARASSCSISSDKSYVLFGGVFALLSTNHQMKYPFVNYNPTTNIWRSLPLPPGNNYTEYGNIINIGNDTLWSWGGYLNGSTTYSPNILNIFDYKTFTWTKQTILDWPVKISFTSVLARDNNIYIFGGYSRTIDGRNLNNDTFNSVIQFNTQNFQWNFLNATGATPSNRRFHTVNQIPDTSLLIIYGGLSTLSTGFIFQDTCYIYNTSNNSFTGVQITASSSSSSSTNHRFGHYATIISKNYLFLAFGFSDPTTPASSISVLDISDPFKATWFDTSKPSTTYVYNGLPNGLNRASLIAIIVVVVVVVLGGIAGILFYIRHKRKQKKKQFMLEEEDPRKTLENNNHNNHNNSNSDLMSEQKNTDDTYLKPDEEDHHHKSKSEKLSLLNNNDTRQSIKPFDDSMELRDFNDNITTITGATITDQHHQHHQHHHKTKDHTDIPTRFKPDGNE